MKQSTILDSINIKSLIAVWFFTIIAFSAVFYGLATIAVNNNPIEHSIYGFGNAIYFSFVTALTIGYGGVEPIGIAKPLVVFEAVLSVALMCLIISTLVRKKQDEIIDSIKELNYEETVNMTIQQLYLFRNQTMNKNLEEANEDLKEALENYNTTKDMPISINHLSLVTNSINYSLSRFVELLAKTSNKKTAWKNKSTAAVIELCNKTRQTLHEQYNAVRPLAELKIEEKLEDLDKTLATMQKFVKTA